MSFPFRQLSITRTVTFSPLPPPVGHWHYYERYIPFDPTTGIPDTASMSPDNHTCTDPKSMTFIVSGAPGDVEKNDACPGDPALGYLVPTCSSLYGYGVASAINATHFLWNYTTRPTPIGENAGGAGESQVYNDYLWIIRS